MLLLLLWSPLFLHSVQNKYPSSHRLVAAI